MANGGERRRGKAPIEPEDERSDKAELGGASMRDRIEGGEERTPAAGKRTVLDPVCGASVVPSRSAPSTDFEGQRLYFCSESCKERFEGAPWLFVAETGDRRLV